jgi:hypothetical protein
MVVKNSSKWLITNQTLLDYRLTNRHYQYADPLNIRREASSVWLSLNHVGTLEPPSAALSNRYARFDA